MPDDDDDFRSASYYTRRIAEAGQNTKIGVANLGGSDDNSMSTGIQKHF